MTPDQLVAVLISLVTGASDPDLDALRDGGFDERYPLTVEACPRPLGPLEVEGQTVICGRISVPEDHGAEGGETIPLAFAVLKSRSQAPAPDPVIYLHGGPGGFTVQEIPFNASIFDFLRDRRDIVIFDQRGAGISDRTIACYTELATDFMDFARPDEETMFDADQPMAKCVGEIYDSGVDLPLYNTTQSAQDVRAIMDTLGYPTYNAFGISYGTKLAMELARSAPRGLRAVVIDSISMVDNPAYDTNAVPVDEALGWIVDFCAEDAACAEAFPDLEGDIATAGEVLASGELMILGEPAGPDIITGLLDMSNKTAGPFTTYMPAILHELAAGETTTLTMLLTGGFTPDNSVPAIMAQISDALSDTDAVIAEVLLMQAEQMRSQVATAGKLLTTLSDDISPSGAADTEILLDEALSEVVKGMEEAEVLRLLSGYAALIGQEPDKDAISLLVSQYFPETELPRLMALVAAMTEEDVIAFYDRAKIDAARITSQARIMVTLGIIACQEDFPFNSVEGYDEVATTYRFPVIDAPTREENLPLYEFCGLFEPQPREGFHEPITTELPVLAMSGTKDTQTNSTAAETVTSTLPNGQAVLFPEAGHATIQFSQCAKDVAESFIEAPDAPVNAACTEALKPTFYIPPTPASDDPDGE
ncbi:alpha/beta hydrolase [Pelagovum pacificum]|uniref:Alpha/beta hydrolase n=1 Tax=Pelagovum pacificum TaxID=2588711 RepID=A0A5C5GAY2_9RHOB|nr:alpha/beta fold hydrolase [Pelagovum pacificum]QQA41290.1 alpha/beta fold hydrolase [Pelagovum pacificum]TNY31903.1 alpha/beta hydrolase [Pelagovum pacificum]